MRIAIWIIIIVLTLAIGLGVNYLENKEQSLVSQRSIQSQTKPDFFMDNITTVKLNNDGSIQYRLNAKSLTHFKNTDTTKLKEPHLIIYQKNETPWVLTARHGTLLEGSTLIQFNTDVQLIQKAATQDKLTQGHEVKLNTSELLIRPESSYASTNKPVSITTAFGDTTAVGLKAYLKINRLELLSEVTGVYNREKIKDTLQ